MIAAGRLEDSLVDAARALTEGRAVRWIDRGDAATFDADGSVSAVKARLSPFEDRLDVIVTEERNSVRLFVADMDSTMIGQECIDELADYAGFKPQVAAITERAMQGELDFASALAERVALIKGLDRGVIGQCLAERIRPNPGARTLLATLRAHGARSLLVSGGFTDFVAPIARDLGFDAYRANVLASDGDRLDGTTSGPIIDSAAKLEAAREEADARDIGAEAVLAVGDGANDGAMVSWAGQGVGYHPKPALAALANGSIRHHDLTALLWAAGIPRRDWRD